LTEGPWDASNQQENQDAYGGGDAYRQNDLQDSQHPQIKSFPEPLSALHSNPRLLRPAAQSATLRR